MFSYRWRPLRLFGIPVGVHPSWLLILALLTWTMHNVLREPPEPLNRLYPADGLGLSVAGYWLAGLLAALAFFVCIVLHEMGHALVARSFGMPIRGITLFLFGGVAELEGGSPSAGVEFLVAVAGPLVSLVLGVTCAVLAGVGHFTAWSPVLVVFLACLAWVNLTVLVFNLIPAFPLDGGRVLRSILWGATGRLRRSTHWAALCGQGFAWLLVFLGVVEFFSGAVLSGFWLGLIGLFLNNAARGSYQQVLVKQLLEGEPVRRFMTERPIIVPPELDLYRLVEEYVFRHHRRGFPVGHGDHVEGYVSTEMLAGYPREEWERHSVAEVMRRDLRHLAVTPDTDALAAMQQMQRTGSSRLLVLEGGRLVGVVSLKDLLRFLRLKLELEGDEEGGSPAVVPSRLGRREGETAVRQ
jgi:Zn-dependent protease/CBS domain-containing protein